MTGTSIGSGIARRWWIIVGVALVGAVIGAIPEPDEVEQTATSFQATHTMLANDRADTAGVTPDQVTLLATVGEVPQRVGEELGLGDNSATVAAEVEVNYDFATGALTVSTEQDTAAAAEELADTYANTINAYLVERQDNVYQQRLAASRQRVDELESDLDDASAAAVADPDDAARVAERDAISREYGVAYEQNRQLEQQGDEFLSFTTLQVAEAVPVVDSGLSAPTSRTVRAVMGGVVGGVVGLGIALALSVLDRKARSREQIEELMDMRARVMIPRVRRTEGGIVVTDGRHDPLSDSYRTVRNVVGFVQSRLEPADRARTTLVVSPGPGDGKTSLSANLAAAFLESGKRTIAVNADFRRPRLSMAITGMSPAPLPFEYADLVTVSTRALLTDTKRENLKILDLASVDAAPGELVRATLPHVDALAEVSDEVVIDTSPVGITAEVLDLVPHADVIVITARIGHTSTRAIERTIGILRDIATAPMVLVISGAKNDRSPYYEYTSKPARGASGGAGAFARFRRKDDTAPVDPAEAADGVDPGEADDADDDSDDTAEIELQTSE